VSASSDPSSSIEVNKINEGCPANKSYEALDNSINPSDEDLIKK